MIAKAIKNASLAFAVNVGMITLPAQAHHSFAMYDLSKPRAITGVLVRSNPDAFHYQMFIAQLDIDRKKLVRGKDGKPVIWVIEQQGAAVIASQGITEKNFPPGAIVSIGFYPLRNGKPGGSREHLGLFKCPGRTVPMPGKYCNSVDGSQSFGSGDIPDGIAEGSGLAN